MSSKLDPLTKIVLATGQINYLSSVISIYTQEMRDINLHKLQELQEVVDENNGTLNGTAEQLYCIMEYLANYMNAQDFVSDTDIKLTDAAFKLLAEESSIK